MFRRFALALLVLTLFTGTTAYAAEAALVVNLGNRVITECVEFDGPVTTAFELLQLSGLDFTFQQFNQGAAICSIENTGCPFPAESCFCQCSATSEGCTFFGLFFVRNGQFVRSNVGASQLIVHQGDVIVFSFEEGGAAPEEVITFEEVCGDD
jgi:hypothetical protein